MKKTITSSNWLNKAIAIAMMMVVTAAMPAMAGDRKHKHRDRKTTVVVVTDNHRGPYYDKMDRRTSRYMYHRHHAYRPIVKTCTFRVSRHAARHHAVAKAERIRGVMEAYWNPRTREMTVHYDARVTSPRRIMRLVA